MPKGCVAPGGRLLRLLRRRRPHAAGGPGRRARTNCSSGSCPEGRLVRVPPARAVDARRRPVGLACRGSSPGRRWCCSRARWIPIACGAGSGRRASTCWSSSGDAVARLLDAWDEAGGYDVPSLTAIGTGGARRSPSSSGWSRPAPGAPERWLGSSETGPQGTSGPRRGPRLVRPSRSSSPSTGWRAYSTRIGAQSSRGSGVIGRVASGGRSAAVPQRPGRRPRPSSRSTASGGCSPATWPLSPRMGPSRLIGRGSVSIKHRRREGLPRRGRERTEGAPRGLRRRGGGRTPRAVG